MSNEKCNRSFWTPQRLLSVKIVLPGFLSLILLASIVILSQFENVHLNTKDLKPSLSHRKLQAVEVHASNASDTKNDTGLKAVKPQVEKRDSENGIDYLAIIKQLLKDNYELQQRFNETLAVLQKCVEQKSVGCSSPETPNCANSETKVELSKNKDILITTTSTGKKDHNQNLKYATSNQKSEATTTIELEKSAKIQIQPNKKDEEKTDILSAVNTQSSNKTVVSLHNNDVEAVVLKDLTEKILKSNSTDIL